MTTMVRLLARVAAVGTLAGVLTLGSVVPASAATITLTSTELASFTATAVANPVFLNGGLGNYSVNWNAETTGAVTHTSGLTLSTAKGAAGHTFSLVVFNNNGSSWNFSTSINNGAQSSGSVSIVQGGFHVFNFTLGAALTQVSVTVGGHLPINGTDRGAEYRLASSVPEGGTTVAFMGLGLLVMGLAGRKFLV